MGGRGARRPGCEGGGQRSSNRAGAGSDATGPVLRPEPAAAVSVTSSPRADAGSNDAPGARRAQFLLRLRTGGGGAGVSSSRSRSLVPPAREGLEAEAAAGTALPDPPRRTLRREREARGPLLPNPGRDPGAAARAGWREGPR